MRRFVHLVRLLREVARFSVVNRIWWPVPLVVLVLLAGAVMVATQVAAPFTVYTLF